RAVLRVVGLAAADALRATAEAEALHQDGRVAHHAREAGEGRARDGVAAEAGEHARRHAGQAEVVAGDGDLAVRTAVRHVAATDRRLELRAEDRVTVQATLEGLRLAPLGEALADEGAEGTTERK